ncbi:NADH-quinone oxidoreductase subunit N [Rhodoflexus sp.]
MLPENIIRDLQLLWPELAVSGLIVLLLIAEIVVRNGRKLAASLSVLGLVLLLAALYMLPVEATRTLFADMLLESPLARQFHLLLTSGTLLAVLLGQIFPEKFSEKNTKTEYYILLLGALLGLLLMVRAQNLLMLFMALETVSICSYGLVFFISGKKTAEAGVKYILFGIFSSALMLYGISLWWSIGGSLFWGQPTGQTLPEWGVALVFLLILTGLLFKTSTTPFHIWTPDVFEGAPLPVAAFFAVVPKIGALAALLLLAAGISNLQVATSVLVIAAIVTLIIGTLAALWQTNMRRLMAYSAIAQAGFLLMAIIASAPEALNYYLWVYLVLNFLAFGVMAWVENTTNSMEISAFAGKGAMTPLAGIAMTIAMAGLIGLPPTAGFAAKLLVFSTLWQQWQQLQHSLLLILLITGLAATVVSVYFYFKLPFQLFFRQGESTPSPLTVVQSAWLLSLSAAVLALLFWN